MLKWKGPVFYYSQCTVEQYSIIAKFGTFFYEPDTYTPNIWLLFFSLNFFICFDLGGMIAYSSGTCVECGTNFTFFTEHNIIITSGSEESIVQE